MAPVLGSTRRMALPPRMTAARSAENATPQPSTTDLEPGWRAARALVRIQSDELLAVMLRPSFRPVRDIELVRVLPCPYCLDGGLRTAGTVRTRGGRAHVRACDTCAKVEIEQRPPNS